MIAKITEMLDYKTTGRTFFEGRKLHVQLHRPLTPIKKDNVDAIEKALEADKNNIQEKITNINKITVTPKHPNRKGGAQCSFAIARKASLDRHKGF